MQPKSCSFCLANYCCGCPAVVHSCELGWRYIFDSALRTIYLGCSPKRATKPARSVAERAGTPLTLTWHAVMVAVHLDAGTVL
jgi:hypothetical protein